MDAARHELRHSEIHRMEPTALSTIAFNFRDLEKGSVDFEASERADAVSFIMFVQPPLTHTVS